MGAMSPRFCAHQLCTSCTEGVRSTRSGSRLISFMMLERRTGSSCRRKAKDVFSQALLEPGGRQEGGQQQPCSWMSPPLPPVLGAMRAWGAARQERTSTAQYNQCALIIGDEGIGCHQMGLTPRRGGGGGGG